MSVVTWWATRGVSFAAQFGEINNPPIIHPKKKKEEEEEDALTMTGTSLFTSPNTLLDTAILSVSS